MQTLKQQHEMNGMRGGAMANSNAFVVGGGGYNNGGGAHQPTRQGTRQIPLNRQGKRQAGGYNNNQMGDGGYGQNPYGNQNYMNPRRGQQIIMPLSNQTGPRPQEDHTLINTFTNLEIKKHIESLNKGLQIPPNKLKRECLQVSERRRNGYRRLIHY